MQLPFSIEYLLTSGRVESERLEFKAGWNPKAVLHTLCAFANDFHNLGGGYVVLGVESRHGRPVLPPTGLPPDSIDRIQREVLRLGYLVRPTYHPVVAPCVFQERHMVVLWAPGGQTRPYKAPVSLAKDCREYAFYMRKGASTVRARDQDERELLSLTATVPFDDRIRHDASLDDLDLALIRDFLKEVGSDLYPDSARMDFPQLCRQMNIVSGPDEFLRPLNIGLLLFNPRPDKFFPYTQIDVVQFPEGRGGDRFSEKIFRGPIHRMVRDALAYLRATLIEETVIKHPDRAEAERFYNYPFQAIEEALVNAIYHRGYDIREPVEVQVLPDRVIITSQPGPDRSIRLADLRKDHFVSRRYRNRRIGEFLKELGLTEGRGTGIPKIMRAIRRNGSPRPKFATDSDRTYFAATFRIHPKARGAMRQLEALPPNTRRGALAPEAGTKSALSRHQVAGGERQARSRQWGGSGAARASQ
ncbi:MAG: transcriptional regulator [Planctomycetes bacterium]|nr:transcriptional regulator [Planctomycetota bacterium]